MSSIIFILIIGLLLVGVHFIFKDSRNKYKEFEQHISEIDNKINDLKSLEEFMNLRKDIVNFHDNTDTLYKDIRSAYRDRYFIVTGIIKSMQHNKH